MRDKHEILKESHDQAPKAHDWDSTAILHERLTIEVLCDIRDELVAISSELTGLVANTQPKD